MEKELKVSKHPNNSFMYVITCSEKIMTLMIDENDLLVNDKGELSCCLETTLKKNKVSAADLNEWRLESIQLIEVTNDSEEVLCECDADILVHLFKA